VAALRAIVGWIRSQRSEGGVMKKILFLALIGVAAWFVVKKVRAAD
jgi:hypothetical protein